MAVTTVEFAFIAKDISVEDTLKRVNTELKNVKITADKVDISQVGKNASVVLQATAKDVGALQAALGQVQTGFTLVGKATEAITTKPLKDVNASIKDVIKSLKEANDLATLFSNASLLGSSPKATIKATGNAEIKAIQNQLNLDLAKAQKEFDEEDVKKKGAYKREIKNLYAQSAADILAIVRKTQAELANLTAREGTVKLGQTNSKDKYYTKVWTR
jgi:hypothetical protein